jgi:2'-5' RNA ligase
MKRLFIGVPIESEKAAKQAESWRKNELCNSGQLIWGNSENWHITLFFIGNTHESGVDILKQLIEESFSGFQKLSTQLNGVGIFPNLHNPKVLWLGLENLHPLMPAYEQLGDLLHCKGFGFDNKPLKPHLTLARIKKLENQHSFEHFLKEYQQFNFGTVDINRVVLFESILTLTGPIYKPLYVKWLE